MTRPRRVALAATVTVVLLGGSGAYVATRLAQQRAVETTAAVAGTVTDVATVTAGPHIVFRSTALDENYGKVAIVSLDDPGGARAVTDVECERVFATATTGLCLAADRGVVSTYRTLLLDADFAVTAQLPLVGLPSRARLSADGSLAATTTFVTGHSYASVGFSTQTVVSRVSGGSFGDLEKFQLLVDGQILDAADRNLWGVTFADDDTFYATAASGGTTWLVKGSLSDRTLESLHTDAECPSLSPDGTQIVYKKREGAPAGQWRLAVYDLATGAERPLPAGTSVDDQVEWLDGSHILFGLPRPGSQAAVTDVWSLDVDGTSPASILIEQAWSPAVIR